jgi:hypothetical protein
LLANWSSINTPLLNLCVGSDIFTFCAADAGELINTELNKNMDNAIINIFFTVIAAPILQSIYVHLGKLI